MDAIVSPADGLRGKPHPDIFDRLTYNIGLNPFGTIKAVGGNGLSCVWTYGGPLRV